MPEIAVLVDLGGYFKGYLHIFQGKKVGPNNCAILQNYVKEYYAEMGWKCEPQATYMTHMTNIDLAASL